MGDPEKEVFRKILRQCEIFYGLRLLTYCIMSNHFHILVEVPEPKELTEDDVFLRVDALYPAKFTAGLRRELAALRQAGLGERVEARLDSFRRRMWNLSNFMKSLKQRFSTFYNRNNIRCGTLWEERFRSVIVEGEETTLLTMSLYIDLNPIRAGIASDPAGYRFCGYAEAVGGGESARTGLTSLVSRKSESWKAVQAEYRRLLFWNGEETSVRKGFTTGDIAAVESMEGHLPAGAALQHRIHYLSQGVILGSRGFIDNWFSRNHWRFGKRTVGQVSVRLPSLSDLRIKTVPDTEAPAPYFGTAR